MMLEPRGDHPELRRPAPPGSSATYSALARRLQWIHVPRLDYSLMIDGSAVRGRRQPGVEPARHARRRPPARICSPSTRSWAPGTGRCRSFEFGVAGQVVPTNIVTNSKLSVAPSNTRPWARLSSTARRLRRQRRERDAAAAADGARRRALPRAWRRAREVFDIELDVEYETWSRVQRVHGRHPRPRSASYRARDVTSAAIAHPEALARHGGGEARRRRRRDSGPAGVARRRLLRDGGRRRGLRQRRLRRRRRCRGQPRRVGRVRGAGSWRSPTSSATSRASASPRRTAASTSRSPTAPASRRTPIATSCNPNYLGQPAPTINGGTLRAALALSFRSPLLYRFWT